MNRIPFGLKVSGILIPLFLVISTVFSPPAQASAPPQAACGEACSCEGYTPERVWEEYKQRVIQDNYYFYDYPSKCSEKYGSWVEPGSEPLEDILRKIGYFLEEMKAACQKCRGEAAPLPPAATNTPPPAPPQEPQPAAPRKTSTPAPTPTPSATPELPFPEIVVELENTDRGVPYKGVVADGQATLDIFITNKDPGRQVSVSLDQTAPGLMRGGKLVASDGSDLLAGEFVVPPGTRATLRYVPPAQLAMTGKYTNMAISDAASKRRVSGYPAGVPFLFGCPDCQVTSTASIEFLVYPPPVQLVHGYLGGEGTWNKMVKYLTENNFDAVPGTYDPPTEESWIQNMAATLGDDIEKRLNEYRDAGIKIKRVDVVTHSMGGLITRWYLYQNPGEGVRKLIMLATPNHGVNDWHRATRTLASVWVFFGKHVFASGQLNANSIFFAELNAFENEMQHLDPSVEYANIIGRAGCGAFCPDDAVVPIASAHLNGVVETIFDGVIHSSDLHGWFVPYPVIPWYSKSDVGITDSPAVMEKVREHLTNPIPRAAPDKAWQVVLQGGEGEVFLSEAMQDQKKVENYPVKLSTNHRVRTGFSGKAVIIFFLDGEERKRIEMAPYSQLEFGPSSAETLTSVLMDGSAKYTSTLSPQGEREECQFDVSIMFEGSPPVPRLKADLRDLETEFVLTAGEQYRVNVLKGSLLMDTVAADGAPVVAGFTIRANPSQAVVIAADGAPGTEDASGRAWWEDAFYGKTYTPPEWVAAGRRSPGREMPGNTYPPGLWLMGAGLCSGGLILAAAVVIILARRREPGRGPSAPAGKGLFGLSGCLPAALIAGLALACLVSAAGLLWWRGVFDLPEGTPPEGGKTAPPQVFVAPAAVQPPPAPIPLDQLPASLPPGGGAPGQGPRLLLAAKDGLWLINEDGSGLTHLVADPLLSPRDLRAAVSPDGKRIAFITASDPASPRDPTLFVLSLPEGKLETFIELTTPETAPSADAVFCDPRLEAARAPVIGSGLAWSPDGSSLAFTASLDGPDADVYLFSREANQFSRISDEPGHAYDLHWAPEENKVLYFTASCFGSGAGFETGGVYLADADKGGQARVYMPNPESYGEVFVSWLFSDRSKFLAASTSGCPYRDMRLVDMNTGESSSLFEGCFEDYALGPTTTLAVLASRDLSDKPGLYLYAEPGYPFEPAYAPLENGRDIEFDPGAMLFLARSFEEGYTSVASFDLEGRPAWYQARGGLPAFSRDGEFWLWEEGGRAFLGGKALPEPLLAVDEPLAYPFWFEYLGGAEIAQRALFAGGGPAGRLFLLVPGEDPRAVGEGIRPVAAPALIFP